MARESNMAPAATSTTPAVVAVLHRQAALQGSAFENIHDELVAYFTLFCEPRDLLALSEVNSAFYVFCKEEPLWMLHCLRLHGGAFRLQQSWKATTFFPRDRPAAMPAFQTLPMRGFASDFLYRRWYRCHMNLSAFTLPPEDSDPTSKRLRKMDVRELSYKTFYERYARVPFIIQNAIKAWPASTEWTLEKLAARFGSDQKLRITHNLDFSDASPSTKMSFADYLQYTREQHDETPLYIFDPRFGEKMPQLLGDYRVDDLHVFREDLLNQWKPQQEAEHATVAPPSDAASTTTTDERKSQTMEPDFRWIVIGPERSGAPWHTDPARTSAWNALVQGRKRWALYPPGCSPPGVALGKNANGREHALGMTSLYWYLHVYPTLAPEQRPLEVIQEPGDVIYVPSGWWHLVLNLDVTVAVTQNFIDSHNLMAFLQDLHDDQQDEALHQFHAQLTRHRPETADLFRIQQVPRYHGYLTQDLYIQSFHMIDHWRKPLARVLRRYLGTDYKRHLRAKQLKALTSGVNPAFAVGRGLLVKFFSQFNQDWGELDFPTFLAPSFDDRKDEASPCKRQKVEQRADGALAPHELRQAMPLRVAMEESFRIERDTLAWVAKADAAQFAELHAMVPQLHHHGHLLYPDQVDDGDGGGSFWRWPYVVIEYKSDLVGLDKAVARGGLTAESWTALAQWLGNKFLPLLHSVPLDATARGLYGHSKSSWAWYAHYLLRQRRKALAFHMRENVVPAALMRQLETFLGPVDADTVAATLLPTSAFPVLLHGDLTQENILGRLTVSESASSSSASDLTSLLTSIGCAKYKTLLVDQEELTLESFALLTEQQLQDLGVPLGPRLSMMKAQTQMEAAGTAVATVSDDGEDDDDWDTSSDSSSSSSSSDSEDEADAQAAAAKRQAKFQGSLAWTPAAVIDFADAKTGDPLYDLVAVFSAALHCDQRLFQALLRTKHWQTYIQRESKQASATSAVALRERMLKLMLLHQSRAVRALFEHVPQLHTASSWEHVAAVAFGDAFAV